MKPKNSVVHFFENVSNFDITEIGLWNAHVNSWIHNDGCRILLCAESNVLVFFFFLTVLCLWQANPGLRNVHAIFGTSIMALFLVHAVFGLQLGLSY